MILSFAPELALNQIRQPEQFEPNSLNYSNLSFSQDLNIYSWVYSFYCHNTLGNSLEYYIKEDFRSTLQSIAAKDHWKDKQDFVLNLTKSFKNNLSLTADFNSHILSDPLAGFDNDVIHHSVSASMKYQPNQKITIAPLVTSKWQTQREQSDYGLGYGVNAELYDLNYHGYQNNLTFYTARDFFPKRKNADIKLRYQIKRQFYDATIDTFIIYHDKIRRDTFDADTNGVFIRNLTQTFSGIENHLSYNLAPNIILYLKNSIATTSFEVSKLKSPAKEISKDDRGFESKHTVRLSWQKPRWYGSFGWNFRSRAKDDRRPQKTDLDPFGNRHPSLGFDTDEVLVKLFTRGGWAFSNKDSIGFVASVSKFQFDTSDTTNPNNHDQLRWQFTVNYAHAFGSGLKIEWKGGAFLNHFVYISSKFSSDNNWERVLQLTPVVIYRPHSRFAFRQSFTVRAKYQTYDFNDNANNTRDSANRQFIFTNSTRYGFNSDTWVELGLHLELAEQGRLFYRLWRQRLALSWRNQELQLLIKHKLGWNFLIALGGSFFHQVRWNHNIDSQGNLIKTVRAKHTNLGPALELSFKPNRSLEFVFWGDIQFVLASRKKTEQINNFDVKLNWLF